MHTYEFLKAVLDSVTEHIAVIDGAGRIRFVNEAWRAFGLCNGWCGVAWDGVDYLDACRTAAASGDDAARQAAEGIARILRGDIEAFQLEYPCHSPDKQRWFMMNITPLRGHPGPYFVVSHRNITERRLAEERALRLSRLDALTDVANRRYLDEFLEAEWRRCARAHAPISLAIIDIDQFKQLNDRHGHQAGDACLVSVAAALKHCCRRPGDLLARYGGDEFVLVLGNSTLESARTLVERAMRAVAGLRIPNEASTAGGIVTLSVGLAATMPGARQASDVLMRAADGLLYAAKAEGRNRMRAAIIGDETGGAGAV